MTGVAVSRDTCDAKHGELVRAVEELKEMMATVLVILNGNGKPGLRQTQAELATQIAKCEQRHAEMRQAEAEAKLRVEGWVMFLLKPIWPYIPPAIIFGLWYMSKGL